jgi:hypothetical protein
MFGVNPTFFITFWTRFLVLSETSGMPLMTRDTVWYETPDKAATFFIVTFLLPVAADERIPIFEGNIYIREK